MIRKSKVFPATVADHAGGRRNLFQTGSKGNCHNKTKRYAEIVNVCGLAVRAPDLKSRSLTLITKEAEVVSRYMQETMVHDSLTPRSCL